MNSGMIGKIDKAHRYAQEPERMKFSEFKATFQGSHDDYVVSLDDHGWHCTCHTFEAHALESCSHVMAAQQLLAPMLTEETRYSSPEYALSV